MKKFGLPNSSNHSRWGKALLAASLLLVAAAGVLQLYDVQAVFFPGSYHAAELKLIRHECAMINTGLISLRIEVAKLQELSAPAAPSSPPQFAAQMRPDANPAWPTALYAAKKDRVYVARKLKYIDIMLKSMQQAIERQRSAHAAALVDRKPQLEQTWGQIQDIRERCQRYNSQLINLSEKINKLAESSRP